MQKGSDLIEVAKSEVNAKKKEGYKVTSKYAQKRSPKNISTDKK